MSHNHGNNNQGSADPRSANHFNPTQISSALVPLVPPEAYQYRSIPKVLPTSAHGYLDTRLREWYGYSVMPFLRWHYTKRNEDGDAHPNQEFDEEFNSAIYISDTIDWFDRNPQLIHELVLRIFMPHLGHPCMQPIVENKSLVWLLIYRHFDHQGGLDLPPTQPAVAAIDSWKANVAQARANGVSQDHLPRVRIPSWTGPPPPTAPRSRDVFTP